MSNRRTFYALEQVAIKKNGVAPTNRVAPLNAVNYASGIFATAAVDQVSNLWEVPRGVQSVAVTTNFNREPVFQLGQVELYEYSERQPDIEVTIEKVIDGTKPLWFMLTDPTYNNNLVGRTALYRSDIMLNIYPDTQFRANTNSPLSAMLASGMYLSSVTFTFPVDGPVTESVTVVGNDKIWANFDSTVSGQSLQTYPPSTAVPTADTPVGVPSGVFGHDDIGGLQELAGGAGGFGILVVGSGVQRREDVDLRRSVLPSDIPGVVTFVGSGVGAIPALSPIGAVANASGQTQLVGNCNIDNVVEHIQSITCTVDLGREDIFELGSKRPFVKFVSFPVEVTCSIEVVTSQGDLIDARSNIDIGPDNASPNNTIIIRTVDGMQVDLGDSNVITSIDVGGGEAGGGNMTVTYNYSTFNVFNVSHDRFQPNHRVVVFETGNSRFNIGASRFRNITTG